MSAHCCIKLDFLLTLIHDARNRELKKKITCTVSYLVPLHVQRVLHHQYMGDCSPAPLAVGPGASSVCWAPHLPAPSHTAPTAFPGCQCKHCPLLQCENCVSWLFQDATCMKMHGASWWLETCRCREIPIYDICQNIRRILFPQPILPFPIMFVYIQLFLSRFLEAKKQKHCYILLWHKQKQRKLSKKMFNTTIILYFIQNFWLNVYYASLI